ncbi:MAG: 50S ribosomal protein L10 [Candidatus Shapirobacteria bacterium]|nr:50S ribosomal protein L10 [Candidatus Shapirobacteria bacterium]
MVKQTKVYEIDDLKAKIKDSKGFFLVGYQGWDANFFNQLRQRVGQVGGQLKVIRNSLFGRAIEDNVDLDQPITGPTVCLFSLTDETAPLSTLCDFLKENSLDPDLKLGFFTKTKQYFDGSEMLRLATLPSIDNLRAMLVGGLAANLSHLLFTLGAPIQNFTSTIRVLQNQQGGEK